MLTEVRIPALDGWGHAYQKFNRRSEDWAMVAVCAVVKASGGVCEDVRIGLTNMGSMPLRATAVEEALRGQELDAPRTSPRAAEQAADGTEPAGRPQRQRRLQAPPGPGAHPAGDDGGRRQADHR